MAGLGLLLFVFLAIRGVLLASQEIDTHPPFSRSRNMHPRFQHALVSNPDKQRASILLFISITSGPHHTHLRHAIRNSWAIPCRMSPDCDYRFFVDAPGKVAPELELEASTYNDMVFRGACDLMRRHPDTVNYGNSPPIGENLKRVDSNTSSPTYNQTIDIPDYPARRMYKIDWKVCFMRWGHAHYQRLDYHLFVEDDSFTCTENLIYQFSVLRNLTIGHQTQSSSAGPSAATSHFHFRTGTHMYDGWDDSSTIMDGVSASKFVAHYPSLALNCDIIENSTDKGWLGSTSFLSWGNSWRKIYCNWGAQLQRLNVSLRTPTVSCTNAKVARNGVVEFSCLDMPLVLHHSRAAEVVISHQSAARLHHVCEYMWLIDKIKEPEVMFQLWNQGSVANRFHNFTAIFTTNSDLDAWTQLMQSLEQDEREGRERREECPHFNSTKKFPCLFETNISSPSFNSLEGSASRRLARRKGKQRLWSAGQAVCPISIWHYMSFPRESKEGLD